jgi:DNA-binding FadR family transcriptional regulator
MINAIPPLKTESLVDLFIKRFEELIISGKISIGQKLPPERELAFQLGVSRPVVHEGLVELEVRGLVKIKPRAGVVVSDFRREGSLALLNSLVSYSGPMLAPDILDSVLKMRVLFETETARLAAMNRSEQNLMEFNELIENEKNTDFSNTSRIVSLDFSFHLLTAVSSGNLVYPLLMNSFRDLYTSLTGKFFQEKSVIEFVFFSHAEFVKALTNRNQSAAVKIMQSIMEHGESNLRRSLIDKK